MKYFKKRKKEDFSTTTNNSDIDFELSKALIHADKELALKIIEENKIDCNGFLGADENRPILIEAVSALSKYRGIDDQFDIVEYLLKNGADPNQKTVEGYNALHIALSFHDLSKISLLIIRHGNIEVNAQDKNGNNPIFIAIREYRYTWREEQKEINELRFQIIKELLERGADVDLVNNHGISSNKWLEISDDKKLHDLVKDYRNK